MEEYGALRVNANGEEGGEGLPLPSLELLGGLGHGDGVEIDDGVNELRVGLLLELHPLPQSADIVAEVRDAGGLDPREDDSGPQSVACGGGGGALHWAVCTLCDVVYLLFKSS